jgi:hypothetical protein
LKPIKYGEYTFPAYSEAVGWTLSLSSVVAIPIFAIFKLSKSRLPFREVQSSPFSSNSNNSKIIIYLNISLTNFIIRYFHIFQALINLTQPTSDWDKKLMTNGSPESASSEDVDIKTKF